MCKRKKVQTYTKFLWVYLSQTEYNCQEAKPQWTEKMLQRTAVLQLILYNRIKGEDKGRLHEIYQYEK